MMKYNNLLPVVKQILPVDSHLEMKYQKSLPVVKQVISFDRASQLHFKNKENYR